jgi:ABC-type sugar transport system substrate-binding protein
LRKRFQEDRVEKLSVGTASRVAVIAATLAVAGGLVACGSDGDSTATGSSGSSAKAAGQKVYFLNANAADPFWRAAGDGVKQAAQEADAKFTELDAVNDATAQAAQVDTAVQRGADLIVLAVVDSKAVLPQINAALNDGIAVVAIGRPISGLKLTGSIFASEYEGGQKAADALLDIAKKRGLTKMSVLQLRGATSDEAAQLRGSGFSDTLKKGRDGIAVDLVQKGTDWKPEQAASALEDVLTQGSIDAVFTESDFLQPSIVPVLQRNGYTKVGGSKHAILVGVGGLPEALQLIRKGWQDATMNFPIDKQGFASVVFGLGVHGGNDAQAAFEKAVAKSGLDAKSTQLKEDEATGPQLSSVPVLVTKSNASDDSLWGNNR